MNKRKSGFSCYYDRVLRSNVFYIRIEGNNSANNIFIARTEIKISYHRYKSTYHEEVCYELYGTRYLLSLYQTGLIGEMK